jgi:DNA-binding NarL/FixJ family response regulator
MVTEGLKNLLADEHEVVGVVDDGRAMVKAARDLRPDVIVADITMPHLNGIDALAQLKKDNPCIKVIFLTMHSNPAYVRRALKAGASGFVVKHSAPSELILAIRAALKGKMFITPTLAGEMLEAIDRRPRGTKQPSESLTARQREILQLLAEGYSAKRVAETLSISARTVEFHKYQIMETHGFHSSAELIRFAIKHGIITI